MQYFLAGRDGYFTYDYPIICIRTLKASGNYMTEFITILNSQNIFLKYSVSMFQLRLKLHYIQRTSTGQDARYCSDGSLSLKPSSPPTDTDSYV